MKFPRVSVIGTVCFSLSLGLAQTRKPSAKNLPPSAFKLVSVKVIGTSRYQPDDVIRAAGLQLGQPVHDEDLKNVVRLLGESGAFVSVSYSSQFDPEGTKIELKLQDAEDFFPARFDNVVWFSDRELFEKLHASVPLFNGQLPKDGEMAGEVSEALQILLIQKNVAGEVEYLRPGQEETPVDAFVYSVSGPSITIRNVEFKGAGPDQLPLLTNAARRLQGKQYAGAAIRDLEEKTFLPIYHEHGYLKAVLGDPEPAVVASDSHETQVDVMVKIDPGPQYKLAAIKISGNKMIPEDGLQAAFHFKPGQIANLVELDKSLEAVRRLYGARGYVAVSIKADRHLEDAESTVTYAVSIIEGDVYKMGEVEIRGLDSRTTARLQNDWTLRSGDIYDSSYVSRFVEQAYKEIGDWHVSVHETVDPHDKTVDVTVRFDPDS